MIVFSFVVAVLVLLLAFAPWIWVWLSQRKLPSDQRLPLSELLSRLANLTSAASLIVAVIALLLSGVLQLRNQAAARIANQKTADYAAEQQRLLEQSVTALHEAAGLLKEQAEASRSAASYLERQYAIQATRRQEELQRRAMVPDIQPALELVTEDGFPGHDLAVLSDTTWSNNENPFEIHLKPHSGRFELNIRVINQGSATLREGSVSLRTGWQRDIQLGFSNHPPANVERLDIALKNLRPMSKAHSLFEDRIFVFVPRPETGSERLFNLYLHFEGDQAERRDGNIWFKVYFGADTSAVEHSQPPGKQ